MGIKTIAVSSWCPNEKKAFTYKKKNGINTDELLAITDSFGSINKDEAKKLAYTILPADAWLEQDVDLLIPAALEKQINSENVDKISPQVKAVIEAANGPTTNSADRILVERGICIVPDFLANAAGVTCSYFEQVQSNMNFYWDKEEVLDKLDKKMTNAYQTVLNLSVEKNITMRKQHTSSPYKESLKHVKQEAGADT